MNALAPDRTTDAMLAELLRRLDLILAEAVGRRIALNGGVPLEPTSLHIPDAADRLSEGDPLGLARTFGLDALDQALFGFAIAPEIECRYQQTYCFLQGDAARRRPTVDLVLTILCGDISSRLRNATRVDQDAPLRRFGLMHVVATDATQAVGLTLELAPDPGFVRWLLGASDFDPRLEGAEIVAPVDTGLDPALQDRIRETWLRMCRNASPPRIALYDGSRVLRQRVAALLAAEIDRPLVATVVDRGRPDEHLQAALSRREALLRDAVLYVEGAPSVLGGLPAPAIAGAAGPGRLEAPGFRVETTPAIRRAAWRAVLGDNAIAELAGERYPLDIEAIELAAQHARTEAAARNGAITSADVAAAAHAQAEGSLTRLASPVRAHGSWDELVLPDDVIAELRELVAHVKHRRTLRDAWGFDTRRGLLGVTALFAGPSGTGKSLAAEVVATELLLPLWRVDLSRVVSKYIGETERNLSEIFAAAESSGVMLLFDEADALFGKRSEVNDSHDRYANLEISFLLQRMEVYDGIAVLSTNLLRHVDDAFARRLTATVHFPFPDPALRKRLWEQVWPNRAPLADDLEFDELAEKYELTGGNIRNIAVAAATTAASDGRVIGMEHVVDAIAREFRKLGRSTTPAEECAT
jgi:DNA polymerase III delta prime subunit